MNIFKPTPAKTPEEYLEMLPEPQRSDIQQLHELIRTTVPGQKPLIVAGMIGYGLHHFKYPSGREGDWPIIALSNRKDYISLYVCASDKKQYIAEKYKKQLPKATIGKSCIRFKRIADLDMVVLKKLLLEGVTAGFAM